MKSNFTGRRTNICFTLCLSKTDICLWNHPKPHQPLSTTCWPTNWRLQTFNCTKAKMARVWNRAGLCCSGHGVPRCMGRAKIWAILLTQLSPRQQFDRGVSRCVNANESRSQWQVILLGCAASEQARTLRSHSGTRCLPECAQVFRIPAATGRFPITLALGEIATFSATLRGCFRLKVGFAREAQGGLVLSVNPWCNNASEHHKAHERRCCRECRSDCANRLT